MMYYWQQNVDCYFRQNPKFVYYLSAEYLVGQQLEKNLLYTRHLVARSRYDATAQY